jgi:hypothetical protein
MTERTPSIVIEYLDRLPAGWFALGVLKKDTRRLDWAAHIVDVHPDDLETRIRDYRCGGRAVGEGWLSVPGKHRTADDAWEALQNMIATRH